VLGSRAGRSRRATQSAVSPRRALRSFWALRSRVSWRPPKSWTAWCAVVTILPGFTNLTRRPVGTRVALRAYRARLACRTELAIVAGGSRSTGKAWLAGQPSATSRSALALNAWGTGNASAAVRSRLTIATRGALHSGFAGNASRTAKSGVARRAGDAWRAGRTFDPNFARSSIDAVGTRFASGSWSSVVTSRANSAGFAGDSGLSWETIVAVVTRGASEATGALRSDGSTSARVARNTRKTLLAGDAGKTHEAIRASRTGAPIEPVVTRMTAHATRAGEAGGTADSDLLLDMLVKLFDAGDIAIETVDFVGEVVKFFNDSLIVILRSLGQRKES